MTSLTFTWTIMIIIWACRASGWKTTSESRNPNPMCTLKDNTTMHVTQVVSGNRCTIHFIISVHVTAPSYCMNFAASTRRIITNEKLKLTGRKRSWPILTYVYIPPGYLHGETEKRYNNPSPGQFKVVCSKPQSVQPPFVSGPLILM